MRDTIDLIVLDDSNVQDLNDWLEGKKMLLCLRVIT